MRVLLFEIRSVIYLANHTVKWTRKLKIAAALKLVLGLIYDELCRIYGSNIVSLRTILRWAKAFDSGESCLKDVTRSGRPKSPITERNNEAVNTVIEEDARFSLKEITSQKAVFTPY